MDDAVRFLLQHGYAVLFVLVSAEQLGLPIPSTALLLAMGSLAASGRFSFAAALPLAWLASVIGDLIWYEIGRGRGRSVLRLVCRLSLEPDSCVRHAETAFARHGAATERCSIILAGNLHRVAALGGGYREESAAGDFFRRGTT